MVESKLDATSTMVRSESAPRFYDYRGQAKRTGKASAILQSVGRPRKSFGASSSAMYPIQVDNSTAQQVATMRRRRRPHTAPRVVLPVDADAVLIALGLLAGYILLTFVLIGTAARPAPVKHVEPGAVQPVVAVPATVVPADVIPIAPPPPALTAILPVETPAESALAARRAKALELLKKTRAQQSDTVVYRQGLAELVRSYSDTPAGSEALNLLAAPEPATRTSAPARHETPDIKTPTEQSEPRQHFGLGLMD